jgi:1,4-dihydroxy-2-naphthoate octaprenyltransferase
LSWEALAASVPVAVLVALILYVNEIPDRRGDAHAGKRTLPVRLSPAAVVRLYEVSIAAAFASVVVSVALGALPVTALVILLAIPLALRVRDGLAPNYDNPYGLMAIMGVNIRLHLVVGVLLLVAYAAVLVAGAVAPGLPLFLR